MMFADNVVLLDENTNMLKYKHVRYQKVLKKNKFKISKAKIKYLKFSFKNKVEENRSYHNVSLGAQLIK